MNWPGIGYKTPSLSLLVCLQINILNTAPGLQSVKYPVDVDHEVEDAHVAVTSS